jgi:hypothetical protein
LGFAFLAPSFLHHSSPQPVRPAIQFALDVQVDEAQKNRYHELLIYIGFHWPQSAGRVLLRAHFATSRSPDCSMISHTIAALQELMSRIKTATERQFQRRVTESPASGPFDGSQAWPFDLQELLIWLKDIMRKIEVLKLISFENLYILRANFGQQLHL